MITADQLFGFREDGYIVLENFVPLPLVIAIRDRFDHLFAGEFDTGIYPDEWYWREGMSLPDVTRHMANLWKSDLTIASVVLSGKIGEITARLAGWKGARIGQDTLWMKPPGTKAIALHQDASFVSYLNPPEMITCWLALDDTLADSGTLEYVKGSHCWQLVDTPGDFHAPDRNYRFEMHQAAHQAGVTNPEIVKMEVKAGTLLVHHGRTWHGSGPNTNATKVRRSIGIHTLDSQTTFQDTGAAYIYGRYKRVGSIQMDESFFPILWREDGYRTPFLQTYVKDALAE